MAKRYKYSFAKKKEAEDGVFSSIMALVSVILFLIGSIASFVMGGKGGIYLGAMGFMAILFSVYGFYRGLRSFSEKDCNHKYSIIGSLANGVIVVGWIALFLIGIS